ncbi:DUF502 domain-containing protein [Halorubellus sp. JP-L1]|uniref:DUF502 domain-containing protein n=1 Tax=Halorubellus sp. JP-L1 TaxID=2715753 RepID=UPI00140C329E|nr:DUF502 domain-containing protein [Halorubellus sp. JP-L1]NHN40617.1 DUF502 domain-containing protein [Halorubellus sp. JP-L1]
MKSSPTEEYASPREAGRSAVDYVRDAFIGGLAVVVPFVITLIVLATIVQYVVDYLSTVIVVAPTGEQGASPVMFGVAIGLLLALVFVVGFVTQFRYGETFIAYVDGGLARIPGFGAIYESFREMSDVMMESDEQSFRDVKLVEFPHEGAYTLGFLTAESAPELQTAAGRDDLVTLFLPLAPNPVMGGHLVHVPTGRVMDVDMTVDEGIRTVVTSGVATGGPREGSAGESGLSADELERLGASSEVVAGAEAASSSSGDGRSRESASAADRRSAYESHAEPDSADEETVPSAVEEYGDETTLGDDHDTPDAVEGDAGDGTLGEEHDTPSTVAADSADGSLGRDFETPSDVDTRGRPASRWRDQTRPDGDAPTTDDADAAPGADGERGAADGDVESVEDLEDEYEPGANARWRSPRPDADHDAGEGR